MKGTSWNKVRLTGKENKQANKISLNGDRCFFYEKYCFYIFFYAFWKPDNNFKCKIPLFLQVLKTLKFSKEILGIFVFTSSNTAVKLSSKINPSSWKDQFVYMCVCVCISQGKKEEPYESNANYSADEQFPRPTDITANWEDLWLAPEQGRQVLHSFFTTYFQSYQLYLHYHGS